MSAVHSLEFMSSGAREKWRAFIELCGLRFEGWPETVLLARDGDAIAGCAALDGDIIKYVAVSESLRETGLAARMVSALIEHAFNKGNTHLFLFTSTKSAPAFGALGFAFIAEYSERALMEYGSRGIADAARELGKARSDGVNGAIVMNANPFTLGHQYLARSAAERVDRLHLFLVREDGSEFPYAARLKMAREGIRGMTNVYLHEGNRYILSRATFPAYFLKDADTAENQAGLDVSVFAKHIAPALALSARFAGEEPLDAATRIYNEQMLKILSPMGIEVVVIPRMRVEGEIVSASAVRARLRSGDIDGATRMLPESTIAFLRSPEGGQIIERMRTHENT